MIFRAPLLIAGVILLAPSIGLSHSAMGTGFERPRSALERAAHTEALVIAKVTQAAQPLALPDNVPASTLAFEVEILKVIAGDIITTRVRVMQLGKKQLAYPLGSIILLSLNRTAHFVSANVPRPAELAPPANAPAWFTEQTRAETVDIHQDAIEPLTQYIATLLPFEKLDDPLKRTAGIYQKCYGFLEADRIPPLLAFEVVRDLLIASLDARPTVNKMVALNLLRITKNSINDFRSRHGALALLLKAAPGVWRPLVHEILKTPLDSRLHGVAASQLAHQPTPTDAPLFMLLLTRDDEYLVRSAAIGLGKLQHVDALSLFENISLTASQDVARTLISALGLMNAPAAKKMIQDWSQNHPVSHVQALAARQLVRGRF